MDKTTFIRNELQNMINKNEVPAHLIKEVNITFLNVYCKQQSCEGDQ